MMRTETKLEARLARLLGQYRAQQALHGLLMQTGIDCTAIRSDLGKTAAKITMLRGLLRAQKDA